MWEELLKAIGYPCLNAPFGARCFLTALFNREVVSRRRSKCTFWCSVLSDTAGVRAPISAALVLMHLLALGAF